MIEFIIKSITNFSSNWEKVTSTIMESQFITDYFTIMGITPRIFFLLLLLAVMILMIYSEEFLLDILKLISLILGCIIVLFIILIINKLESDFIPYNYLEADISDWSPKCYIASIEDNTRLGYLSTSINTPTIGRPLTLVGSPPVGCIDPSVSQAFNQIDTSYVEGKRIILMKIELQASGIVEYTILERAADTAILWENIIQIEALEKYRYIRLNYPQGPGDRVAYHYFYDYLKVHNRVVPGISRTFLSVLGETKGGDLFTITEKDAVFKALNNLPRF